MPKVRIEVELSEERLWDYQAEAERRGVEVETLVEQTVNALMEEREQDIKAGTAIPVIAS